MAKPDIKKIIQNQPKNSIPKIGGSKSMQNGLFDNSPMLMAAQAFIENMSWKYKLAIGGAIYLLVAGAAGTVIGIIKLINLAF